MKTQNSTLQIITTGLLTLILLSTLLFALRKSTQATIYEGLIIDKLHHTKIFVDASKLLSEPDKTIAPEKASIFFAMGDMAIHSSYGVAQEAINNFHDYDWPQRFPRNFHKGQEVLWSTYHEITNHYEVIYFDKSIGLIVHCKIVQEANGSQIQWAKKIIAYAGREEISKNVDPKIKIFGTNLLTCDYDSPSSLIVYDQDFRNFVKINFRNATVTTGPRLEKSGKHHPIQIARGTLTKNDGAIRLHPNYRDAPPFQEAKNKLMVLDQSGRINYLNIETLEFSGQAGNLFSKRRELVHRIEDFAAYTVSPIVDSQHNHKGLAVATLPRDLFSVSAQLFDTQGQRGDGKTKWVRIEDWGGGPLYLVTRYLLENLQPALLSVASFATEKHFEALAGERALFLLSNSFVAMFARDSGESVIGRCIILLVIISPSLLLGGFLGWRVVRDAKAVGLSKQTRRSWLIATILLGLTAYLTYRITRPQAALVTCKNCGKLRRPDYHLCHHCQSQWQLPELNPPQWTVRSLG